MMDWGTLVGMLSGVALGGYAAATIHRMNGRSEYYDQRISALLTASSAILDRLERDNDRVEITLIRNGNDIAGDISAECGDVLSERGDVGGGG